MNSSPFTQAKTLRDIGSYLPVALGGRPYDQDEHSRAVKRWNELRSIPLPTVVENAEFFNSHLLDSNVLALSIEPDLVVLTLDDYDVQVFADGLCLALDLPRLWGEWPVDLQLHEPTYVRAVALNGDGSLRSVHVEEMSEASPGHKGDFINDWFFQWEDRLGWVAELYGLGTYPHHLHGTTHLLVDCARASARDRRLDKLTDAFGPAVVPLWQDVRRDFAINNEAKRIWIAEEIADYLPEQIAAHSLRRKDFIPAG